MDYSKKHPNLKEEVFTAVGKIPKGKVATYGQIGEIICSNDSSRANNKLLRRGNLARYVGWMLHLNKSAEVPCHRVVDRNGRLAPNFSFDGWQEQRRRLEVEGVEFIDEMHVDLKKCLWQRNPKSEARNTKQFQNI